MKVNYVHTQIMTIPGPSTISDIAMPATPGINKRYYYFNQSHSATYNQVFRVGKNGELGINAAYLNDRDERSNQSVTTTLLPDGSKNVVTKASMVFSIEILPMVILPICRIPRETILRNS